MCASPLPSTRAKVRPVVTGDRPAASAVFGLPENGMYGALDSSTLNVSASTTLRIHVLLQGLVTASPSTRGFNLPNLPRPSTGRLVCGVRELIALHTATQIPGGAKDPRRRDGQFLLDELVLDSDALDDGDLAAAVAYCRWSGVDPTAKLFVSVAVGGRLVPPKARFWAMLASEWSTTMGTVPTSHDGQPPRASPTGGRGGGGTVSARSPLEIQCELLNRCAESVTSPPATDNGAHRDHPHAATIAASVCVVVDRWLGVVGAQTAAASHVEPVPALDGLWHAAFQVATRLRDADLFLRSYRMCFPDRLKGADVAPLASVVSTSARPLQASHLLVCVEFLQRLQQWFGEQRTSRDVALPSSKMCLWLQGFASNGWNNAPARHHDEAPHALVADAVYKLLGSSGRGPAAALRQEAEGFKDTHAAAAAAVIAGLSLLVAPIATLGRTVDPASVDVFLLAARQLRATLEACETLPGNAVDVALGPAASSHLQFQQSLLSHGAEAFLLVEDAMQHSYTDDCLTMSSLHLGLLFTHVRKLCSATTAAPLKPALCYGLSRALRVQMTRSVAADSETVSALSVVDESASAVSCAAATIDFSQWLRGTQAGADALSEWVETLRLGFARASSSSVSGAFAIRVKWLCLIASIASAGHDDRKWFEPIRAVLQSSGTDSDRQLCDCMLDPMPQRDTQLVWMCLRPGCASRRLPSAPPVMRLPAEMNCNSCGQLMAATSYGIFRVDEENLTVMNKTRLKVNATRSCAKCGLSGVTAALCPSCLEVVPLDILTSGAPPLHPTLQTVVMQATEDRWVRAVRETATTLVSAAQALMPEGATSQLLPSDRLTVLAQGIRNLRRWIQEHPIRALAADLSCIAELARVTRQVLSPQDARSRFGLAECLKLLNSCGSLVARSSNKDMSSRPTTDEDENGTHGCPHGCAATIAPVTESVTAQQPRCPECYGTHPLSLCTSLPAVPWKCHSCGDVNTPASQPIRHAGGPPSRDVGWYVCLTCMSPREALVQATENWADAWECRACQRLTPMVEDVCMACGRHQRLATALDDEGGPEVDVAILPLLPARCGSCANIHLEALCPYCSAGLEVRQSLARRPLSEACGAQACPPPTTVASGTVTYCHPSYVVVQPTGTCDPCHRVFVPSDALSQRIGGHVVVPAQSPVS